MFKNMLTGFLRKMLEWFFKICIFLMLHVSFWERACNDKSTRMLWNIRNRIFLIDSYWNWNLSHKYERFSAAHASQGKKPWDWDYFTKSYFGCCVWCRYHQRDAMWKNKSADAISNSVRTSTDRITLIEIITLLYTMGWGAGGKIGNKHLLRTYPSVVIRTVGGWLTKREDHMENQQGFLILSEHP